MSYSDPMGYVGGRLFWWLSHKDGQEIISKDDSGLGKSMMSDMPIETTQASTILTDKGFFQTLLDGDFGLAKTYWFYGILISGIFHIISNFVASKGLVILLFITVPYECVLIGGVWKAANKYQGQKVWVYAAKLSAILWSISLFLAIIAVESIISQNDREEKRNASDKVSINRESSAKVINKNYNSILSTDSKNINNELPIVVDQIIVRGDTAPSPGSSEVTQFEIKRIQFLLSSLGYSPGPIDGIPGNRTKSAISHFEHDEGLTSSGIPSVHLINILESKLSKRSNVTDFAAVKSGASHGYTDNYREIVDVQNKLKELGYYTGNVSGVVDEETSYAITQYQKYNRIIPISEPGQVDFNILRALRIK